MKSATKQARITADFFAGRVTLKQANKLARKAKRAAMHKGANRRTGRMS